MKRLFTVKWLLGLAVILGMFFVGWSYLANRTRTAPILHRVSRCKAVEAEMRRVGDRGLEFDVSTKDFSVTEGTTDAAPVVHGFDLAPKQSKATLEIEFGGRSMESIAPDPALTFLNQVVRRPIFDDKGKQIGEDEWGYRDTGERWRHLRFTGIGTAKYGLVDTRDAEKFDQIINSACFAPH